MDSVCPICNKAFPIRLLERHVNNCLDNQVSKEGNDDVVLDKNLSLELGDRRSKKRSVFSALGLRSANQPLLLLLQQQQQQQQQQNQPSSQTKRFKPESKKSETNKSRQTIHESTFKIAQSHQHKEQSQDGGHTEEILRLLEQNAGETYVETNAVALANERRDKQKEMAELKRRAATPLAHRVRPKTLDDFIGQEKLVGENAPLRNLIQADLIPSFLLWGPPGCGKTTIARIIAKSTDYRYVELSGADSNAKSLKDAFAQADNLKKLTGQRTILFLDEIHRYNKAVQDLLLPVIERGTCTVIGATTENPSFNLNNALLSRLHTFVMEPLTTTAVVRILHRALYDINQLRKNLFQLHYVTLENGAFTYIAELCMGDSRVALNILETVNAYLSSAKFKTELQTKVAQETKPREEQARDEEVKDRHHGREGRGNHEEEGLTTPKQGVIKVSEYLLRQILQTRNFHQLYDRNGDGHYDVISAFHKSVRGSNADAAIFYLVKMLSGGEDPLFILRRMIVIASEDIGLRDSSCLPFMVAAKEAVEFVGMPEGEIILAHCANKLARAQKSTKSYRSLRTAQAYIQEHPEITRLPVPFHLRNAPTKFMKEMGFGDEYKYNPRYENGIVRQLYFPEGMEEPKFLEDTHLGTLRDPEVQKELYEQAREANADYEKFKSDTRKLKMLASSLHLSSGNVKDAENGVGNGFKNNDEIKDCYDHPNGHGGDDDDDDAHDADDSGHYNGLASVRTDEDSDQGHQADIGLLPRISFDKAYDNYHTINNFGKSYDEFLDPGSQPEYFDDDDGEEEEEEEEEVGAHEKEEAKEVQEEKQDDEKVEVKEE